MALIRVIVKFMLPITCISLNVFAQKVEQPGSGGRSILPGSRQGITFLSSLGEIAGSMGGKLGCAAQQYQEILNLDSYGSDAGVGGSNAGFARLMEADYNRSKCFRVALHKFYQEVDKADRATPKRSELLTQGKKPRFNASVDDLGSDEYKPGSLYTMAMKVAGNDPMLAMQLIAFCGHDDISQTTDPYGERIFIGCPPSNSFMFFNGSLFNSRKGPLPVAGRRALEASRGITNETQTKNYHVMMGAYIGCRLVQRCNMDAQSASDFEGKAALAYRLFRLRSEGKVLQETYKKAIARYKSELSAGKITQNHREAFLRFIIDDQKERENQKDPGKRRTDEQIRQKSDRDLKRLLPLLLFEDRELKNAMNLIGKVGFTKSATLKTEKDRDFDFLGFEDPDLQKKCKSLVPDKCDDVLSELKSWNADLIWTANQHSMGAKFGGDECKKSAQPHTGGQSAVCSQYNREPDLSKETMIDRSEDIIGGSSNSKTLDVQGVQQ